MTILELHLTIGRVLIYSSSKEKISQIYPGAIKMLIRPERVSHPFSAEFPASNLLRRIRAYILLE